jgi:hypothetical protein
LQAGNDHEDRSDGGERQLKAGFQERVRIPHQEDGRAYEEEVPAIAGASAEPGERGQPTCYSRPDDGRLPADGDDVTCDREQRPKFPCESRNAQEPCQEKRAGDDVGDVLPGHGEEVVETRRPEAVSEPLLDPLVLPQDDPRDDGTPLSGHPGRKPSGNEGAEGVGEAPDAPSAPDHAVGVSRQDDMYALPAQV